MLTQCLICNANNIKNIINDLHGYHDIGIYEIYTCPICNSNQIDSSKVDYNIYNTIYENVENVCGYDRYVTYSNLVLKEKNPLKTLARLENNYYPIYDILNKENKKCNILEIGCGLGYLTYSINKFGHNCTGIDVSAEAVKKATNKYGDFFKVGTSDSLQSTNIKYDYIIATELIEHVPSPFSFIESIKHLLSPNGKIIITTPNKSFYTNDSVWIGDLPPVHVTWIGEGAVKEIAKNLGLQGELYNMSFIKNSDNLILVKLLQYINQHLKGIKRSLPHYTHVSEKKTNSHIIKTYILKILHLPVIRYTSNFIYSIFSKSTSQMCIIFSQK